ncbi:MAG: FCD domain-containing protein, partial [Pseudomonadota bacterium]
ERHAHHALLEALASGDGDRAEELMTSHLVDLSSCLDLGERLERPMSLREALS